MPISVTFAHPLSRRIVPMKWGKSLPLLPTADELRGGPLIAPERIEVGAAGSRIGDILLSEVGPWGLKGTLTERALSWRPGEFVFPEEELNRHYLEALCRAGVRELDLPLQENPELAADVLPVLMLRSVRSFRKLRIAHPEIAVTKEKLPVDIEKPRGTAKRLKIIAKKLKEATYPDRYSSEKIEQTVRAAAKKLDNDTLTLLLIYSVPLNLWGLSYGGDGEVGPNAIAKELLSRPDPSRPAILAALVNSSDAGILQSVFQRLETGLTEKESALLISEILKYCQGCVGSGYCEDYVAKKITGALELLGQMIEKPFAGDRNTLLQFSRSDFGLDPGHRDICQIRDVFCLKALDKIFASLSQKELLSYFDKKEPAVAAVRKKLFEHPLMPESFCRKILFKTKDPDENDLEAYLLLRPRLSGPEVNELALLRKNTPALRAELVRTPALSKETRLTLMFGSRLDLWDDITKHCETVLVNGINYLWEDLTAEELAQLIPTGHANADILLTTHPKYSKASRLAFLVWALPRTHTYCDRMVHQAVVLSCLRNRTADFAEEDFQKLYAALRHWVLKHYDICEAVLFHPQTKPDPATVAGILYNQINYRSLSYREYLAEGIDGLPGETLDLFWLDQGQVSALTFLGYKQEALAVYERLRKGGLIDADGKIKPAKYNLGSEIVGEIKSALDIDWPEAHSIRELFETASQHQTLVLKYHDLVYLVYFTPRDMERVKNVLGNEKFVDQAGAIQTALAKELMAWIFSSSQLLAASKFHGQKGDKSEEAAARFPQNIRLLPPDS